VAERSAPQLRLRVFAGLNGSGKSTVIKKIQETEVGDNVRLDFGIYINADDIAQNLRIGKFTFFIYKIRCTRKELVSFAESSGLVSSDFTKQEFEQSFVINGNTLKLSIESNLDRVAQIVARYLRQALIKARRRFSFETVFSHESNLDDMKEAAKAGYKVYLYFVSTESPEINKYRVALKVKEGGHNVLPERIEKRYYRSLELSHEATEIAYQAFFFDNSINDTPYRVVGHFKKVGNIKDWQEIPEDQMSVWFKKYYLNKDSKGRSNDLVDSGIRRK